MRNETEEDEWGNQVPVEVISLPMRRNKWYGSGYIETPELLVYL